eukprot:1404516-Rhodomonas_salina.3
MIPTSSTRVPRVPEYRDPGIGISGLHIQNEKNQKGDKKQQRDRDRARWRRVCASRDGGA